MIINLNQDIKIDPKVKELRLSIYLEGSGNPSEEHKILAFSINGKGYGLIPALMNVDKIEEGIDLIID